MCSYISSVTTIRSSSRATSATSSSSSGANTAPVGLCGWFSTSMDAAAAASRSGPSSMARPSVMSTGSGRPSANCVAGMYDS